MTQLGSGRVGSWHSFASSRLRVKCVRFYRNGSPTLSITRH
jgi:hypothetical protein